MSPQEALVKLKRGSHRWAVERWIENKTERKRVDQLSLSFYLLQYIFLIASATPCSSFDEVMTFAASLTRETAFPIATLDQHIQSWISRSRYLR